jgi:hypothetical protein
MNSEFEKLLQGQPMREIPGQWRARILDAAQPSPAWWWQWLWPCPRAWAILAAAWVVILVMNLAAGKDPARPASATIALSHQELRELRHQQQVLAELILPGETAEAEPPKVIPSPRSERRENRAAV